MVPRWVPIVAGLGLLLLVFAMFNASHDKRDCSVRYSVSGDVINVELGVCGSGSAVLEDMASVRIDDDHGIVIQLVNSDVPSGLRFVLNGEALLKSGSAEYRVSMPCLISAGAPCYRVMILIPGYDAPLKVVPGTYTVTLRLKWSAEGSGVVRFALRVGH